MSRLRVLIADDEALVRVGLRDFLNEHDDIELVAECQDGEQTLRSIVESQPDLAFLDIKMPGLDGFEVLAALPADRRPVVVFVTAFNEFALQAFEVHAVDYLLKPFDKERFETALSRARERHNMEQSTGTEERFYALLRSVQDGATPRRFLFGSAGKLSLIKETDIEWVEAADNYVIVHLHDTKSHLERNSLKGMLDRLNPQLFVRTHRSAIVNITLVDSLEPEGGGDFSLQMKSGAQVRMSRNFRQRFEALLAQSLS